MAGTLLIFSPGLWRLRHELAVLTGLVPKFAVAGTRECAAIAGWGHKPTARRARRIAERFGKPYIAFEDGFLRSVRPGAGTKPLSLVMDRSGIYYDARAPSDLETLLASPAVLATAKAETVIAALKEHRLSKYNDAPARDDFALDGARVLIVDQTFGDASIEGGLSDEKSFTAMVEAAVTEHAGSRVAVKLHPETMGGAKRGYLRDLARKHRLVMLDRPVNPWSLLANIEHVYTVSSQLGFEALMAGCKVTCFGAPFYAGWGVTQDRVAMPRRAQPRSITEIAAAAYLSYAHYFDPWLRRSIDVLIAIDHLAFLRDKYAGNGGYIAGFRIPPWKRRPMKALFAGPGSQFEFFRDVSQAGAAALAHKGIVAAWGKAANQVAPDLHAAGIPLASIEDGFIRSAGLGAAFTPSVSFTIDRHGIYYDPYRPSDLESLLLQMTVSSSMRQRAAELRARILRTDLTKYNIAGQAAAPGVPDNQSVVLVIGQVADDEAVRLGAPATYRDTPLSEGGANLALLRSARARHPDAFLIYKPHPDVERLGRAGAVPEAHRIADLVANDRPIVDLFRIANRVETVTSLAGFEALLRGIPVTAHGRPFYAGWSLTEDLDPPQRRGRALDIDALVAGALILYPHYYDAASNLPCPVEIALDRLDIARAAPRTIRQSAGEWTGRAVIAWRRMRKE